MLFKIVLLKQIKSAYNALTMNEVNQEHILFLTGKLAEKRLQKILKEMTPTGFSYEIRNIGVSVAALMTAQMIVRRVIDLNGANRVIVPGLCRGDLSIPAEVLGVPFIRGPVDLKDLPIFLGRDCKPVDLSRYDVEIFAEIVDAPLIGIDDILQKADRYRRDGANVIDIGCLPDTAFPHLEDTVKSLHDAGFKVSVDSLEADDLLRGGKAGADYLLSLKESTLWIADEVDSIPILIPNKQGDMSSLFRAIEKLTEKGQSFYADAILDPIHFGFTESIIRYYKLRQEYPDISIMMGVGNLTELTEADTTGINAMLFGLISEMKLNAVLVTAVSPHCCTVVREADKARRLMFAAREDNSLPKGLDSALLGMHARKPFPYTMEEIVEIAQEIKDPSYRIQISKEGIHVYNRDGIYVSINPFDLFSRLIPLQDDASHAFYMGVELAKAQIAWQLGKSYTQDEELNWGACVEIKTEVQKENDINMAHAMKALRKKKKSSNHRTASNMLNTSDYKTKKDSSSNR